MPPPSWVELVGRNWAAAALYLSGSMSVTGDDGSQVLDEQFRFWHGPEGRWRVERHHELVYVSSADNSRMLRVDGELQRLDGGFAMVWFDSPFSPLDLLGEDSLLRKMSSTMEPGDSRSSEVGGWPAWTVDLSSRGGDVVRLSFDDQTGILVEMDSPSHSGRLAVSDLQQLVRLDEMLFECSDLD